MGSSRGWVQLHRHDVLHCFHMSKQELFEANEKDYLVRILGSNVNSDMLLRVEAGSDGD